MAVSLRGRTHVATGAAVRPRLVFYKPPAIGKDVCDGWHWSFIRRSSATGCSSDDGTTIYRNVLRMQGSEDMAEFLVHEWMHSAGFSHGLNVDQDGKEKRNSVPIHTACLAVAFPVETEMAECANAL